MTSFIAIGLDETLNYHQFHLHNFHEINSIRNEKNPMQLPDYPWRAFRATQRDVRKN